MEKREFIKFLDDLFKAEEFKKHGNNWQLENYELRKCISLQRSNFGNNYYLNYGFIFKCIELGKLQTHIGRRLSSENDDGNQKIMRLLNLDFKINDEERKAQLSRYLNENMLEELKNINTEADLLESLKKRPHLNDVPIIVKKHYGLV